MTQGDYATDGLPLNRFAGKGLAAPRSGLALHSDGAEGCSVDGRELAGMSIPGPTCGSWGRRHRESEAGAGPPEPSVPDPARSGPPPSGASLRCVLRLRGGLVHGVVDAVLDRCLAAVDGLGPTEVVIDLAGIEAIDASGLGMLRFLRECVLRRGMQCQLSDLPARCLPRSADPGVAVLISTPREMPGAGRGITVVRISSPMCVPGAVSSGRISLHGS